MVEHSRSVPGIQAGDVPVSAYWPYAPDRVILVPDRKRDKYRSGVRQAVQSAGLRGGWQSYRQAALRAPASKRKNACREGLEFEDSRVRLAKIRSDGALPDAGLRLGARPNRGDP